MKDIVLFLLSTLVAVTNGIPILRPFICTSRIDILLAIDASSNFTEDKNWGLLVPATRLAEEFQVGPNNVQIGAFVYGRSTHNLFNLNAHKTTADTVLNLLQASHYPGSRRTNQALDYVLDHHLFGTDAGGRTKAHKVVIVFTHGQSFNLARTAVAAEKLKKKKINVITIGLGTDVSVEELNKVASSKGDVFLVPTFDDFETFKEKIARRVCNA